MRLSFRIIQNATYERLAAALTGKVVVAGPNLKKGDKVTAAYLKELDSQDWFKLRMEKDELNEQIQGAEQRLKARRAELDEKFEESKGKLQGGDDLAPGVLKIVKVYLAIKRRIQPGDKMAGRHGNKGRYLGH